ncbi:hypothetical protein MSEO_21130 [Mycobacterium seoulense]|uniref:Uncharacterized protein n=1 Tax=Mycobacterium seoulense TaxID=386911 RepID=A0A7I7NZE3_9MYCO|nr:hypothetical protein MSEO_21130 [Mycobacterium seoulense]
MPLTATEILPTAGTGLKGSALGTGADDGLTSQRPGWPTVVVIGPAWGPPVEHAPSEIVAAMVAVAMRMRFASWWWRAVLVIVVASRLPLARVGHRIDDAAAVDGRPEQDG